MSDRRMAAAMCLLVLVAACGGDDALPSGSLDEDDVTSSAAPTQDATVTTASPPEADNIVDPPVELAGSSWKVNTYELQATAGLTNVFGSTEVTLDFGVDGRLTGFNTCNTYDASWLVEGPYYEKVPTLDDDAVFGQGISISDLEFADEDCPEGFESEQQEDIFASLLGADRWRLSDDGRLFLNGAGIFIEAEQLGG